MRSQPKSSSQSNRWQLAFAVFAVVYAAFLLFNLSYTAIQWDEVTHFNGGLLLLRGNFHEYMATNAFYPPMFDLITAGYFGVAGASVFTGRLVAVTFSVLSLWVVFEMANRMYGPKTALISAIVLGITPGFVWLSRMAMIETMLVFFFTVSMLFFFNWLRALHSRDLIISGVAFGVGFLVKYQILVAGIVMITSILILARSYLKAKLARFPLLIVAAVAVAIPWFLIAYQAYSSGILNQWIYALQIGNPEKSLYSIRFPTPIFYLIEMTWPYSYFHPISLFTYVLGLLGIGVLLWRRKQEDKFLLIWFLVVYIFFTLIANRQWRYVVPLFPILAISASSFILFTYNGIQRAWQSAKTSITRKRVFKVVAGLFIFLTAASVFISAIDAYSWVAKNQISIPIEEATNYAVDRMSQNQSIMVVCPFNLFSKDMVKFYLNANESRNSQVWQYPDLPVDTYTPDFKVNDLIALCTEHNVKYVFLYEYGSTYQYFNTTLTLHDVYSMLYYSGRFTYQTSFGSDPRRIFIVTFDG